MTSANLEARDHARVRRDVREPRFVEWDGRLLLYCFTAGIEGHRFEPDRVQLTRRDTGGQWADPVAVSEPDTVVWRVRPLGDRLVMSVYRNASTLYTTHPAPLSVELWASDDGRKWEPTRSGASRSPMSAAPKLSSSPWTTDASS